ncbi:MAG: hypothetical protein WA655_12280, partial [Candidatus Korobacteraceae bacterium]
MKRRKESVGFFAVVTALLGLFVLAGLPLWAADTSTPTMTSSQPMAFAVSPPLRELAKLPVQPYYSFHQAHPVRRANIHPNLSFQFDPVEQDTAGGPASITTGLSLLGLDNAQACGCEPPDTNAAVGDTQVVEWVNVAYEVFNKTTGAVEAGPIQGNMLWQSLGGACARDNDGDIIAQWDRTAHRWLLS